MNTESLVIHLELESGKDTENLLKQITETSIRPAIEDDWMKGGRNLGGYEGPLVTKVSVSCNGIEIS